MRGRKKKPTVIKLVTGNPGRYPLSEKEPVGKPGIPEAPLWLSEKAQTSWPYIAGLLVDMGVLAVNDALGLEALCEAYAEVREARESLKKPITLTDAEGNLRGRQGRRDGVCDCREGWADDSGAPGTGSV